MSGSSGDEAAGRCPTACDADCDADCHEWHQVPWKRKHQPEDCPAATSLGAANTQVEPATDEAVANLLGWLDGKLLLSKASVRTLLVEREQLREASQLAEAQLTEIGSERAEWKARAQRGDVVAKILRTDLDKATARAEQAEAEVERLREANRTLARFGLRMGGRADEQQRQDREERA